MNVGYIGLGAMGGALARQIIGKFPLKVLDLNPAVVADFEAKGAVAVATAADMARQCDVVFLCLPRSTDVGHVIFGPGGLVEGLSPGKILIDQTSGVPEQTRSFAHRLAKLDVVLFDAPVSGSMAAAEAGTVSIITSGPQTAFDRCRPVLEAISRHVYRCGDRVGNGQTMKSVNNLMNTGCRFSTLEIVALGRKMGLTLEVMTQAINQTTARNFTSTGMLHAIAERRQATNFGLALQLKDTNQALALGVETSAPMPITTVVRGLLQIGVNTLGPNARLEQMIGLIESQADVRFVASAPAAQAPTERV
ncbi:6-phosphogluconate dehydrogenase [Pseudorhodoferax sp. Leaf267]|nr:NAD(P)-dependent oxidoreductase [Pseudorhodoferax sp. Leaf267]KQP23451.1 6-phosphogluconate dehydrogenase [Pseudorhodoferax sp. Leaf267]